MSFLKFLGYYIICFILFQLIFVGFYSFKVIRQKKQLKKNLDNNKIKLVTIDEALDLLEEDKKTWN
jgi:preprotein translocase subunit YajC